MLAAWVDDGRRGIVDVQAPAGSCRLHVIDGELQLDAEDPLAGGVSGPMVDVDLEPLIALLGSATVGDLRFTPRPDPTPRARALPTAVVLMETAVRGRGPRPALVPDRRAQRRAAHGKRLGAGGRRA